VERKTIITGDGSPTIAIPELKVTYHSIHGAIQESKHVFIEAGLRYVRPRVVANCVSVFEMGFGTGLNTLLTLIESEHIHQKISYETIELFPLTKDQIASLDYCQQLGRNDLQETFEQLHNCEWEKEVTITPNFTIKKSKTTLLNLETVGTFELIYFDAFDSNAQPELWRAEIFQKMFSILKPGGILVTYSSKGDVRRAMEAAGFTIEKIPGPPGKREMVRAAHPKRKE